MAVQKADDGDETAAFESRCALLRYDKPEGRSRSGATSARASCGSRGTRRQARPQRRAVMWAGRARRLSEKMSLVKTKAGVAVTAATADGPRQYLLRTREPLEAAHVAPAKLG